jgi:hypothetical protein
MALVQGLKLARALSRTGSPMRHPAAARRLLPSGADAGFVEATEAAPSAPLLQLLLHSNLAEIGLRKNTVSLHKCWLACWTARAPARLQMLKACGGNALCAVTTSLPAKCGLRSLDLKFYHATESWVRPADKLPMLSQLTRLHLWRRQCQRIWYAIARCCCGAGQCSYAAAFTGRLTSAIRSAALPRTRPCSHLRAAHCQPRGADGAEFS